MNILRDWKWYGALTAFVLFAALVVWMPGPGAKPEVASDATTPEDAAADMPLVRPDPTPAEHDAMLQYSVQDGDTVAGIARLFVVPEAKIRLANQIPDGGDLSVGELIWIPAP